MEMTLYIPDELLSLKQWVGAREGSKCPLRPDGSYASSSDPATWSTFDEARKALERGTFDNLGFVFADTGVVGIDIDCGFDDGLLSPLAVDIMRHTRSFTEYSRSGRGMHVYVKGDLPFCGRPNGEGVEIYKAKRFFVVTGRKLIYEDMIENQEGIDYVLETYFKDAPLSEGGRRSGEAFYRPKETATVDGKKITLSRRFSPIAVGSRHMALVSYGGTLISDGKSLEEVKAALEELNRTVCSPPLKDGEMTALVRSLAKYIRKRDNGTQTN